MNDGLWNFLVRKPLAWGFARVGVPKDKREALMAQIEALIQAAAELPVEGSILRSSSAKVTK